MQRGVGLLGAHGAVGKDELVAAQGGGTVGDGDFFGQAAGAVGVAEDDGAGDGADVFGVLVPVVIKEDHIGATEEVARIQVHACSGPDGVDAAAAVGDQLLLGQGVFGARGAQIEQVGKGASDVIAKDGGHSNISRSQKLHSAAHE
ncbi:hypothetical protein [Limnohabitans lacus]|uniref:Uncharacterized protein n=1 Tax=Limnohabitans lacus TaxID=3045173 RepID=A0ABT6XAP9_9BURK|nr:hypothetical protein [Limnohabitans sp. HM2-2]MDI9235213.1 hypothetical protein [Limnohabitans sp. HM2-2]